jgi:hypothetical protein
MGDGMTLIDENKKIRTKIYTNSFHKVNNPKALFLFGLKYIQTPSLLLAQSNEGDSTPEISISIEDGKGKS